MGTILRAAAETLPAHSPEGGLREFPAANSFAADRAPRRCTGYESARSPSADPIDPDTPSQPISISRRSNRPADQPIPNPCFAFLREAPPDPSR
jgi:hypothetical protein